MKASAIILNDQFVIIAADESYQSPSGCSIDKSVNWMRALSNALNVDFFDRSISYLQEGEVVSIPLSKLKKTIEANIIQPETVVFNHTITTLAQLEKFWMVPAKDSWMSRYFTLDKV
jgi:uridine kinase